MQVLTAQLESNVLTELSYLSSDVDAGSSITIDNADGFDATEGEEDYLVIERKGTEKAELKKISAIDGTTITLSSALSFAHKKGIQVQKILFNQRRFYSDTSETGDFSTRIGTEDIEVDRPDGTFFEHAEGTSSTWYKATYYNETTAKETELSDAIATQGSESNHYTSLYAIRRQSGFEEAFGISNEVIGDYRDEAENEFESRIATTYSTPLSEKPKIGRQIVNLLAAGNLLIKEYGMEADIEISKSGARMLDRANELLGKIVDGTLKLIDDAGNLIGTQKTLNVSGSNTYDASKYNRGEIFSLEDEKWRAANPETGKGATH